MIAALIRWSITNRFLVLLASVMVSAWGVYSTQRMPLDALPDLSDVQVIIRTSYPGQAPRIVENQITYPLTTTMLSVPGARTVRGYSFFGDSFVYVLFEDGTDLYWARSRVLEYLNQVQSRLPATAKASLGPDATGVGWIYQYALVDRSGSMDISQLRALQDWFLKYELKTVANVAGVLVVSIWPLQHIGGEFMPRLDEGDLLYMPSALPGMSAGKAGELLQQTDRLIKTVPEVASVYGKAGRADSATDPAPLEMFETTIQFKPREQWRAGMTQDKLVEELDRTVSVPGLANIWVPPIRNRIDMLATGIKSPVGVKVAGTDLATIDRVSAEIERVLKDVPGVSSALAERLTGGRYVDVNINRDAAARYGMNIADVQSVISAAVGGDNIGETVEGLQRFPINMRYPREMRDSLAKLRSLPFLTERGARLVLSDVADIRIADGPPLLRSEKARLSGRVYVDSRGRDLRSAVKDMHSAVVAGAASWLLWLRLRSLWIPLLGWWSQILIDVFTHTADYFPSPVLYPFTQSGFDGIAWTSPWFLALNYGALAAVYLGLWRSKGAARPP
jgi:Cu/Ag efflux pump CusA